MSDLHGLRKARRGTKSCAECRRRKIRCIPSSDNAKICRGCEDRNVTCVPQIFSSRSPQAERLSSRARLSQLETKVASLTKVVYDIRSTLGYQHTDVPEPNTVEPEPIDSSEDSGDDDSNISDSFPAAQPSHLRSLFHNELVIVDAHEQEERLQNRKAKASANLLNIARTELQKLIPSREEVTEIATSASKLLLLLQPLIPPPFNVKTPQELLGSYDAMHDQDVDAISLASWLVGLAMVARQLPQDHNNHATKLKRSQRVSALSQAVHDTIDRTILRHDRLVSTIQGLGMAMHIVWLQMSQGYFHQAWLRLRHLIALAELMGLPKSFQTVQLNRLNGVDDIEALHLRAKLWEVICSGDRLTAMTINLPSGTRRYQQKTTQPLVVDGVVQLLVFRNRLTDILRDIQDMNDFNMAQQSDIEIEASALAIDRQLRELALEMPESWWDVDVEHVKFDQLLQMLYFFALVRVHMPFTMRHDSGGKHLYSQSACMDACEAVAQRYRSLRPAIPSGLFLSSIFDFQACVATIILLLTSHSRHSWDGSNLQARQARINAIVSGVVKLMEEKSQDASGSNSARHGVVAIRSLYALLQQNDDAANAQQVTLKVPLFGKFHIRRNPSPLAASQVKLRQPSWVVPVAGFAMTNKPLTSPTDAHLSSISDSSVDAMQTYTDQDWTPLSWSIEDSYNNFFQEDLMMDDFDQYAMWQQGEGGFQFSG